MAFSCCGNQKKQGSQFEIYDLLSSNQKKPVLQDVDAMVCFSAIQALIGNDDDQIIFFTGNMIKMPGAGADWNVVISGANLFPR
jgi:hypothetical protein